MKDRFDFQQFSIRHDRCAMKVGTDGVLLGAWAEVAGKHVVDVGCGSALIALMAAQRGAAEVTGLEIDAEAAKQAAENAAASPWSDRISILAADFLQWPDSPTAEAQTIDCIVSNPPYFLETTQAPDHRRAQARHASAGTLTHRALVERAHQLLTVGGSLQVILPYSAATSFHALCALNGFSLLRRTDVQTKEGQVPRRTLFHFAKDGTSGQLLPTPQHDTLTLLSADGNRTAAYTELTQYFYLS